MFFLVFVVFVVKKKNAIINIQSNICNYRDSQKPENKYFVTKVKQIHFAKSCIVQMCNLNFTAAYMQCSFMLTTNNDEIINKCSHKKTKLVK